MSAKLCSIEQRAPRIFGRWLSCWALAHISSWINIPAVFVLAGSENNNIMFVPLMIHVRKHCNIFFQQHTMIADDSLFAKQCNLDKKVNCFSQ